MYLKALMTRVFRKPQNDLSLIVILWTFLSAVVSLICSYGLLHPYWIIHPDYIHSFGIYNYCFNHHKLYLKVCDFYGGRFSFSNLPTPVWQASCVLFGSGCVLMFLSTICACLCLCLSKSCARTLAIVGGGLQITAAMVLILGVVIFPLGTDSMFVKYYCGSAGPYDKGHCLIGWAYMMSIMGSALAIFCPILAYFIDHGKERKDSEVTL